MSRNIQNLCKNQLVEIEMLMKNSESNKAQLKNLTAQIEPILFKIAKFKFFNIIILGYETRNSDKWVNDNNILCQEYPCKRMPIVQLKNCSELLILLSTNSRS
jgi:hypothetical protein